MKTLRKRVDNWYLTEGDNTIAATIGLKCSVLLSLANIEARIREYEKAELKRLNPFRKGEIDHLSSLVWHGAVVWAKKHYQFIPPTAYEVESEMVGEMCLITKIVKGL